MSRATVPDTNAPPPLLVAVGAAFALFQAWAYVRWLLADIPWKRAWVVIPAEIAQAVEGAEVFLCSGAIVWLLALVLMTVRQRRMGFAVMLTLAWSSVYWQESLVNARTHAFSYNAHFLHRGDWIPYLPFLASDQPLLDQPLLMEAPVFFWMIPAVGLGAYGLMRLLRRGISSRAVLAMLGAASVIAFEAAFENAGIRQQLLAWNHVPQVLSLWPGTIHQWPLPELLLGWVWSLPALLWFDRDRTALRWLDPVHASGGATSAARVLALSAIVNLAFLAYNLVFMLIDLDVGADFPPWLAAMGG